MSDKKTNETYTVHVPLNASGIKNFKPDQAVKVAAFDGHGITQEVTLNRNDSGKGTASFNFAGHPGTVHVVLGPEHASAEQLKGMQTISVGVSPQA